MSNHQITNTAIVDSLIAINNQLKQLNEQLAAHQQALTDGSSNPSGGMTTPTKPTGVGSIGVDTPASSGQAGDTKTVPIMPSVTKDPLDESAALEHLYEEADIPIELAVHHPMWDNHPNLKRVGVLAGVTMLGGVVTLGWGATLWVESSLAGLLTIVIGIVSIWVGGHLLGLRKPHAIRKLMWLLGGQLMTASIVSNLLEAANPYAIDVNDYLINSMLGSLAWFVVLYLASRGKRYKINYHFIMPNDKGVF